MKFLYIFPHPDDESFGPALAIARHLREAHEVHLLTLTKGEATKQRFKYNYSKEDMAQVRYKELQCVANVLNLSSLTVWDCPDSQLREMDPRPLEENVKSYIRELNPHIVVTYPVYGVSGFDDHIITHAVVKRAFLDLKDAGADYLKRLAFFTIAQTPENAQFNLKASPGQSIDCELATEEVDRYQMRKSLDCYKTYQDVIEKTAVDQDIGEHVNFEIFGEDHEPVLGNLTEQLP